MPKIPIIPPREYGGSANGTVGGTGAGPEPLSPEMQDALKAVEDRTARIDREVAVSQAWRAGIERLTEAEETPGGAPVGFTRSFHDDLDRERQALLKPLPPAGQEPLERDLLDLRADFLDRAAQTEASGMALRRRTGLYDALDGYVAGVSKDPGQLNRAVRRMDSLIAGLGVAADREGPMRSYVRTVLADAAIRRMMEDPSRVERLLADGLYDDVLPEPVKALHLKEAQDKVARETHLSRERTVADLTARAQEGTASDEVILDAERQQTLSPAEGAYLREKNATAAEAVAIRDARIRRVATATERLDPSNPEDQAAGSAYWDSVAEVYASDDPKTQLENELRFVESRRVLPDALERKYRGALFSGDPTVAAQGASAIARLAHLNPAFVQDIPAEEVRRAQAIDGYTSLDVAPDRAVALSDEKIATESAQPAGSTRHGEYQVAAIDEPSVMSDATENGAAVANIATLDAQEAANDVASNAFPEPADVLASLPDAVADVLAEEGLADDEKAAATLTHLTTAALALGLPLTDATAGLLERLADGEQSVGAEKLLPVLWALVRAAGREAVKRLGPLWRKLWRGKERQGNKEEESKPSTPEPPLPRPALDHPDERKDEQDAGQKEGAGPQSPHTPREDAQPPNGSDASEAEPHTPQADEDENNGGGKPGQAVKDALETIKSGWAELRKVAPDNGEFFVRLPEGRFLKGSDGTADLGRVPRIGSDNRLLEQLPIRIFRLDLKHVNTPEKGADAVSLNYNSGVDLTLDVVQDWSTIRRGNHGRLILEKTNGKSRIAVVELKPSANGDYYRVVTSGVRNSENLGKFPVLQRR